MKKYLLILLSSLLLSCAKAPVETILTLPEKSDPHSTSMIDSPIQPHNLDSYMFIQDAYYVDTRSLNQIRDEGYVAGFHWIPFYEFIASVTDSKALYTMKQFPPKDGQERIFLGDPGSFIQNYEESDRIMERIFPDNKPIFVISTAGVEATYLLNLLIQLGYDASLLYNVGPFSNSVGSLTAYRLLSDKKYYQTPSFEINYQIDMNWDTLTMISEDN